MTLNPSALTVPGRLLVATLRCSPATQEVFVKAVSAGGWRRGNPPKHFTRLIVCWPGFRASDGEVVAALKPAGVRAKLLK